MAFYSEENFEFFSFPGELFTVCCQIKAKCFNEKISLIVTAQKTAKSKNKPLAASLKGRKLG